MTESSNTAHTTNGIAAHEIEAALTAASQSSLFLRSRQLQRMLRFLVEEAVSGRGDRLKEYVLGVEVFGRPASYDPRLDSIVRVEARRLRATLDSRLCSVGSGLSVGGGRPWRHLISQ